MYKRIIPMENIVNCRDLGGYPCADGSVTRFGRVLRFGMPKTPTQNDFNTLRNYKIHTVIDLRGNGEALDMPSAFIGRGDFDYRRVTLFEANPAMISTVKDMSDVYAACVKDNTDRVREALSLIASVERPFAVHCFLGKDRTGIISALLLAAAGVDRQSILADYAVSGIYLAPFYKREIESKSGLLWEQDETHLGSPARNVERAFDIIDRDFGGVCGYFDTIGLTAVEQKKLAAILTSDD